MITVLFDVADAEDAGRLADSLACLIPAVVEGLVGDAVIRDPSRYNAIRGIADAAGASLVAGSPAEAIDVSRDAWLLILEPGARPEPGWTGPVLRFIESGAGGMAHFTLAGRHRLLPALFARPRALRRGLLIARPAAARLAGNVECFEALAYGRASRRIAARLVPPDAKED